MILQFPCLAVRTNLLLKEGDFVQGHVHNFDHVTAVVRGAVRVECITDKGEHLVKEIVAQESNPEGQEGAALFNVPAN